MADAEVPLLEVTGLKKYFPITTGFFRRHVADVKAVDGVDFAIWRGETLGLVGESGCGKTTTGRLIMRGYPPTAGSIVLHDSGGSVDIGALDRSNLAHYRRAVQMIFQDPYSSLNPRLTVQQIVGEPLLCLGQLPAVRRDERVRELLAMVGLDARYAERYPHAFSGGQRQRIGIARALAVNPVLIVADEAVSALDVSIQAQIVNLLKRLQRSLRIALLFISHDLGVVRHISDRVAVMYVGKIVEICSTDALYAKPQHPYTEALLSAVPQPDPHRRLKRIVLAGDVADPANRPRGCAFHPRCRYVHGVCRTDEPPLNAVGATGGPSHRSACHFAGELSLAGIAGYDQRGR